MVRGSILFPPGGLVPLFAACWPRKQARLCRAPLWANLDEGEVAFHHRDHVQVAGLSDLITGEGAKGDHQCCPPLDQEIGEAVCLCGQRASAFLAVGPIQESSIGLGILRVGNWKGRYIVRAMRALITGGAGFIGSHLVDAVLERGDSVIALDNLATGRHDNVRHHLGEPRFEFVLGSIMNSDLVDDLVARSDVIFHLAAAVGVKLIVERPLESLITNIRGSEIVFEKAHKHGKKVLVTSTSEIYGKSPDVPWHEEADRLLGSPLLGRWSYSTSKAVDEILAHAYWKAKGLPTVIVRLFNTVGPRQSGEYGMVIPRFVAQALSGKELTVFGDGSQTRCFAYVGDVVPALVALIGSVDAEGQAVNIGSTEEVAMLDLAELVVELTGSSSKIRLIPYEEAYESGFEETPRRLPDVSRARKLIGFEPRTSLREIIEIMIAEAHRR